jgi:hypothetical protein
VWLGTMMRSVDLVPSADTDGAASGARIEMVLPGSPAEKAGLRSDDIVLWANSQRIATGDALIGLIRAVPGPAAIPVILLRDGKKMTLSVALEARPQDADKRFADTLAQSIRTEQDAAYKGEKAGAAKEAFDHYVRAERLLLLLEQSYHGRIDQAMDFDVAHMAMLLKQPGVRRAIPTEADRHNRRAVSILKSASTDADNDRASVEFRDAIYEAPWVPDLHMNRGLALARAGYTEGAIGELRRYLVLDPAALDAASVKQRITELELLADERKPWYPLLGPWTYPNGKSEVLTLRGRKLTLTLVTPPREREMADRAGDVICQGTIHGTQMQGKCYDRPTEPGDIKCLGATQEYDARGSIDAGGQLVIEADHLIHYNPQTCQITAQEWSVMRTLTPRKQ